LAFAELTHRFYSAQSYDDVLLRIAEATVSAVAGCDMASVTLEDGGDYQSDATTTPAANAVDQAQYDAGEGPCLDALPEPVVSAPSFPDARWPALASRPHDVGTRSAVSYQLAPVGAHASGHAGSLNAYGRAPDAFTDEARQVGLVLAAHASIAAAAARERGELEQLADNLSRALLSRDVIGQAKGILMERLKLSADEAFDALPRASQRLNEKLRSVAERGSETGQFDPRELHG
jgi:GAF domain-containing protein